ncbi:MAG: Fic family protein [Campylobacterota bacterium]|nr:Fic family protein [Campylobacterota bacterium]
MDANKLQLIKPDFDDPITELVMELDHLRKKQLSGSAHPFMFEQLKRLFHILESVDSARIEGNRTTVAEYVEQSLHDDPETEDTRQITNVEDALQYIEEHVDEIEINHHCIKELHELVVADLSTARGGEGDRTPGEYRTSDVIIAQAAHIPPSFMQVQNYMDELVEFINRNDPKQYDLIKVAMAHHRFVWIHPFKNGNGRTVRLLTYVMLAKSGFNVTANRLINPAAVFHADRDLYMEMLDKADDYKDASIKKWCLYFLDGLKSEIEKIDKLTDHAYLMNRVLIPSLRCALDRKNITLEEYEVMSLACERQEIKAADVKEVLGIADSSKVSRLIRSMKDKGMLDNALGAERIYVPVLFNSFVFRCILGALREEGFTSAE